MNKQASEAWATQKINNLDLIRLFLALLVAFSHSYPLATGTEDREPFFRLTGGQVTGGHIAVDLFFVISGFLIAASVERSTSIWQFLGRRVRRIYPAFVVLALFTVAVLFPLSSAKFPKPGVGSNVADVIKSTLALHDFPYVHAFMHNPKPNIINGSLWSISYEFWCYIGVAILAVTRLLRSRGFLSWLFVGSIMVSVLFGVFAWNLGGGIAGVVLGYPPFWARLLPMYLAGVVAYQFRLEIKLRFSYLALCCALLGVAAVVPYGWSLLFPACGTYLVFFLAYHPAIPRLQGAKFGDLSYGTYLYSFPTLQLVVHWANGKITPTALFVASVPLTLLCAYASWHGVERWFLRKARSGKSEVGARTAIEQVAH